MARENKRLLESARSSNKYKFEGKSTLNIAYLQFFKNHNKSPGLPSVQSGYPI